MTYLTGEGEAMVVANEFSTLTAHEIRLRMEGGLFFPEPAEGDLEISTSTPMIAILQFGRDASHINARRQLNHWLSQWDFVEVKDIVGRLTSRDFQHHQSAVWELYLNSIFRFLGFSVTHEPLSGGPDGSSKNESPDFLIMKDGFLVLVEAVTISRTPTEVDKKLWEELIGYLQKHSRSDFWIGINPVTSSDSQPKMKRILSEINTYLDSYSPLTSEIADSYEMHRFSISVDGWEFELHVHPIPDGVRLDSFVGMWGNLDSGVVTDTSDLRKQILFKRSKYGDVLPHPFVIAILENSFGGESDEVHRKGALFGQEFVRWHSDGSTSFGRHLDGIWSSKKVDTRLSGLLLLAGMGFGADELHLPEFWANPYSGDTFVDLFPFTFWKTTDERYEMTKGLEVWNPLLRFSFD